MEDVYGGVIERQSMWSQRDRWQDMLGAKITATSFYE